MLVEKGYVRFGLTVEMLLQSTGVQSLTVLKLVKSLKSSSVSQA